VVAVVAAATALALAIVRIVHLRGGWGRSVVAGSDFTDAATVPGRIPVLSGAGYDGQFMYRLALDPLHLRLEKAYGIHLDVPYRVGRIGYPVLAWMASVGGRPSLLPAMMVLVNVAGLGVLGWVGAHLAMDRGRSAAWGLLLPGYFGFGFVLARDLGEIVAAAAVFTALLLIGRGRYGWAAAALSLGVITREQVALSVVALSIGAILPLVRARDWNSAVLRLATIATAPAVVFLLWQGWGAHVLGKLPVTTSTGSNTVFPFTAFPHAVSVWVRGASHSTNARLALACAAVLLALIVAVATSPALRAAWRERPADVLLGAAALLVFVTSAGVVIDVPGDFRQLSELAGACWLVLFGARGRRTAWLLVLVVPVTIAAFTARALVV
jgi:hypothetical protein